jgi:type II secretory pathway predicted ATPase ExeA
MYEEFFGLSESPFRLTSDPAFFYRSQQHTEVLEKLVSGIRERAGMIFLTGEPGTGKSTTLACLRDYLKTRNIKSAFLSYPRVDVQGFFEMISFEMGFARGCKSRAEVLDALRRTILEESRRKRPVVLVVDEAHLLEREVLAEIVGLEKNGLPLLQIVLAGQSGLGSALGQRTALRLCLEPFTLGDTVEYIRFRLDRAGMPGQAVFSEELMADIHAVSGGIPHAISSICDSLLVAGFAVTSKVCAAEMLDDICENLHLRRTGAEPSLPVTRVIPDSTPAPGSANPISIPSPPPVTPLVSPIALPAVSPRLVEAGPRLPRAHDNSSPKAPQADEPAPAAKVTPAAVLHACAIELGRFAVRHPAAAAIAVLLLLGFIPGTPLNRVPKAVLDRAAIALDDDFRSGLGQWGGPGKATATWSFDQAGFVRPKRIALYQPSAGLSDYDMQFLGVIDKQALSWVVRASDFKNYYVVKLVVDKQGPLPIIGVTRYAVVNGKARKPTHTIAPVNARADTLYHVQLNVRGDFFTLRVQDFLVDSWSEPRLRHGGVGFFSARGEASSVGWIRVTHQFDVLGRLCAAVESFRIPTMQDVTRASFKLPFTN